MFFWFKKKKIVLDCFTYDNFAYEYCKPANSLKYLPQWYIDLPGSFKKGDHRGDVHTIKHCIGFSDLFKKSITIPFWNTLKLTVGNKEHGFNWKYKDDKTISRHGISHHHDLQYNNFRDNNVGHFKIASPWGFKTNKFVQFTWHEPVWNYNNFKVNLLPAVIDFKYQHNTEINFIYQFTKNKDEYLDIIFKPRDPLVMLTPLSDENIEIKTHLISQNEHDTKFTSLRQEPEFFNKSPRHLYKMKKHFQEEVESKKCPFGFGKK